MNTHLLGFLKWKVDPDDAGKAILELAAAGKRAIQDCLGLDFERIAGVLIKMAEGDR